MNEEQQKIAIKLLEDFKKEPYVINQGKKQLAEEFDKERSNTLEKVKKILNEFFNGSLPLEEFKRKIDSLNKQNSYWGFRGINGQMFFNMLYKTAQDKNALKELLLDVLKIPKDIENAKIKINKVIDFVKIISTSVDKRKVPRLKSILYFISYFWQIQGPNLWPIFYNSAEQTLLELNFLEVYVTLAEYYESFYVLNKELIDLFSKERKNINLWFVEHVFWKYFIQKQEIVESAEKSEIKTKIGEKVETISDYIPPIISDIINLSLNESNPADFEKKTAILFQMLGFEVELKGQGKGRTVDIIARANLEKPYILLIDCKARSNKDFKFNAGEERTVVEYLKNFAYNYPRDSKLETHYLIISSGFRTDDETVRRKIKAETGTDITFISIQDVLFLIVKKLQNWDFDLEGMREIFQREGLISKDLIQDMIGR